MKTPYPVQRVHIDRLKAALLAHRAALDMSACGCGKTLCAIIAAKELGLPIFVVCPKAVIPSWEKEMREQGVAGTVLNYEKLKTGKTEYGHWDKKKWVWTLSENTVIVFDEAQKLKGPSSQNGKMAIAAKPYRVLMLSATVADDPTELRAVGYLLGLFELPKYWNWCRSHGCSPNPWGQMQFSKSKRHVLSKLHELIVPDKGSRLSIDDLSGHFAQNFIIDDPLDFSDDGKIAKLYEEMEDELNNLKQEMADDSTNPAAQALVAQLRARQGVELCKVPLIMTMIEDVLEEGRSVAVFVNFDATIEALSARLGTQCIIRGGQTTAERQEWIDAFQDNRERVIICNLAAGGVGVSLHDTVGDRPRTALISPSFDAKAMVQALGRIHRAGGKSPCVQRLLVAAGTIEEKVATSLKAKIINQNTLNGGGIGLSKVSQQTNINDSKRHDMPEVTTPDHSKRDHAEHSPSALKMFEICPCYAKREGTNPIAERGTAIHQALESGDLTQLKDDESQAIAQKCWDYAQLLIGSIGQYESHDEERLEIDLGDGVTTFGTADVLRHVPSAKYALMIDYKTGYGAVEDAEINSQAWAYVIGAFQKFPEVENIDFYFLIPNRDEVSYSRFSRARLPEMQLRLQTVIRRAKEQKIFNPQPGVCDYCGRQGSCKALAEKALLIANRYTEGFKLPKNTANLDDIDDPTTLALLLKLAPIMESWAEGVKKYALDKALNEGWELPGYRLTERKTPRAITSALLAYEAVKDTVQLNDFLAACSKVSVPDLEKNFAESLPRGKKAQGKQELVDRLTDAGCLKQDGSVHVLKQEKQ
jgi:hypothetical protein